MKKYALLFVLFLGGIVQAQIPNSFPPYDICDDNNDGIATFDLSSQIPAILGSMNPATTEVHFFESAADAQANANPLPLTYTNIQFSVQTIFIRVTDNTTADVYFSTIQLRAILTPAAYPASLTFCDPMELPLYSLSAANQQITGGVANTTVYYYHSQADAANNTNRISDNESSAYHPAYGMETLFARVTYDYANNQCFSISTLTLYTQMPGCATCPVPINLTASNITDTSFTLTFTPGMGAITPSTNLISVVPLGSAPSNNGSISLSPAFSTPFVITGLLPETCYSVYVKTYCGGPFNISQWSAPLNICLPNCANTGQCAEALALNAFLDSNNNGIKDSGEVNFNNGIFVYQINDSGTDQYGSVNDGSYYIFDSNPANSYDIHFDINNNFTSYYSCSTSFSNITLPDGSGTTHLNFPVTVLQDYVNVKAGMYPQSQPRPGFTYMVYAYYQNNGLATIPSGTLTFTKDPKVTIIAAPPGAVMTPTGFTYSITNLQPEQIMGFYVQLQVPTIPTVSLGEILTNAITIDGIAGDAIASDNTAVLAQTVVGSYDPNDKSESHGGKIGLDAFTDNDYLYYTIQFENTGTASAEFIRIEDTLDAGLDESTFEMIRASHTVNTVRNGNQLTWHFYDINLPPTVTQPTQSHGYVNFRIKPKSGYAVGDIIPNTAEIYFDYNPPIETNIFNTEFFDTLDNPVFSANTFGLYPNPASHHVQIRLTQEEKIAQIQFYDVTGKIVKSLSNVDAFQSDIEVSALAKGVYFVEVTTENHFKQTKKLIIQ